MPNAQLPKPKAALIESANTEINSLKSKFSYANEF